LAVVRMLPGLGDLLCAVPALRAIRASQPDAHVTFIGLPQAGWFADRFPGYIDRCLPCDTCPGLPESRPDPVAHERFLGAARSARFDVAIQLHGDGRVTNAFTAALGAARWGGLARPGEAAGGGTVAFLRPGRHEIDRCLDVVAALGFADGDGRLEFPVGVDDDAELDTLIGSGAAPLAVIHPGASTPRRRWPPAGFASVAADLAARGCHVVVTGGPAERALVDGVAAAAGATGVAGRTSVGSLAALVARARVVVANDTGVVHLAAAVGTPTVTVFAGADRPRWAARGPQHRGVGRPGWPAVSAVTAAVDAALAGASRP
jgi:ADP-heptose:LPS heptosyltransferase